MVLVILESKFEMMNPESKDDDRKILITRSRGCVYPRITYHHYSEIPPAIVTFLEKYGDVIIHHFARPLIKLKTKTFEVTTVIGSKRIQVFFTSRDGNRIMLERFEEELLHFLRSKADTLA